MFLKMKPCNTMSGTPAFENI